MHLLGTRWQGVTYIDTALPFGLHSTPKVFLAVADALLRAMQQNGVTHGLHYLDEFLLVDEAGTSYNNSQLKIALHTWQTLGAPVFLDKIHKPSNVLPFLGIETSAQVDGAAPHTGAMAHEEFMHKWKLLSLAGQLHHASAVVKPGRTFLRQLIHLSNTLKQLYHHIRRTNRARSDIE